MRYVERVKPYDDGRFLYRLLSEPPKFIAKHKVRGFRDMALSKETTWNVPDQVRGKSSHTPVAGKVPIREIQEAYEADLQTIEAERARLHAELKKLDERQKETLKLAYMAGRDMTVAQVKSLATKKPPENNPDGEIGKTESTS